MSTGRSSPTPALRVCPRPINVTPALGLILVLWAVGEHWLSLGNPVTFPSRLMGYVAMAGKEIPSPHCP